MSSIHDDRPHQENWDGVWSGKIASNPIDLRDPVFVTLNAFSPDHKFGPCRWVNREALAPSIGMECLVAFNENRKPYVIAWWDL